MNNAMQTMWHQGYRRALQTITSLRNHSDFVYEKDTKNARKVIILNAAKTGIRKYVPGQAITRDAANITKQEFEMDQMYYFNFGIDHVDKAQTVPGAMEAICAENSIGLAEEGDKYVAKLVKDGVTAGTVSVIDGTSATKSNAIEKVEDGLVVLYRNNVTQKTPLHLEVEPAFFSKVRQSLTELYTNNVEMAKQGYVGKYGNALVSIENLLPEDENGNALNFLRTGKAVAFAEQVEETKNYEVQDGFETAQKGLYVFGGLLVRPEEVVCISSKK